MGGRSEQRTGNTVDIHPPQGDRSYTRKQAQTTEETEKAKLPLLKPQTSRVKAIHQLQGISVTYMQYESKIQMSVDR